MPKPLPPAQDAQPGTVAAEELCCHLKAARAGRDDALGARSLQRPMNLPTVPQIMPRSLESAADFQGEQHI